jgi:hypothetical protein
MACIGVTCTPCCASTAISAPLPSASATKQVEGASSASFVHGNTNQLIWLKSAEGAASAPSKTWLDVERALSVSDA